MGQPGDSILPAVSARVVSTGRGYFAISDDRRAILQYDRNGALVRTIGRAGRGPGEYLEIVPVQPVGDSLFAIDRPQRRLTVLSPSYAVVRTVQLDVPAEDGIVFPGRQCARTCRGQHAIIHRLPFTPPYAQWFADQVVRKHRRGGGAGQDGSELASENNGGRRGCSSRQRRPVSSRALGEFGPPGVEAWPGAGVVATAGSTGAARSGAALLRRHQRRRSRFPRQDLGLRGCAERPPAGYASRGPR